MLKLKHRIHERHTSRNHAWLCSKPVNMPYNLWFQATLLETARAKQQLYCFQPMPRFHWFRFWRRVTLKCLKQCHMRWFPSQTTPSLSWSLRLIEMECFECGSLHRFYSNHQIIQMTCMLCLTHVHKNLPRTQPWAMVEHLPKASTAQQDQTWVPGSSAARGSERLCEGRKLLKI